MRVGVIGPLGAGGGRCAGAELACATAWVSGTRQRDQADLGAPPVTIGAISEFFAKDAHKPMGVG